MRSRRTSPTQPDARSRRVLSVGLSLCLLAGALAASTLSPRAALADTNPIPDTTWVTNGRVSSIVHRNGRVYLGGYFTQVGPNTGQGVVVDATGGTRNPAFPYVNGWVYAAVPDGSGGWYLAGSFDKVGTSFRKNAARITSTGAVAAWNPAVVGTVFALAYVPGQNRVFLGGDITTVGLMTRTGLASVAADTGAVDGAWAPAANGTVRTLAFGAGRVYAGGTFTTVAGLARSRVAVLDAVNGSPITWPNPAPNAPVDALTLSPGGTTAYLGGEFTTMGATGRNHLAALNVADGSLAAWNPGADGTVETLAVAPAGTPVYAGGPFTTTGGAARTAVAALSSSTGTATAWSAAVNGCTRVAPSDPLCTTAVHSISLSGDAATVYLGGLFDGAGGATRSNLAAVSASTGSATAWDPEANGAAWTVVPSGNQIFAGGDLTSINAVTRRRVAALDQTTGALITSFNVDADDWVESIALSGDGTKLFLGGDFNNVNGVGRIHVAAVDATTGNLDMSWNPSARGGIVQALTTSAGRVYAGGRFTSVGGLPIVRLASLSEATGSVDANWHPNPDDWVAAVAVDPGGTSLNVGGNFLAIGGRNQRKLAAVSTTTGVTTAWSPTITYPVLTLLPSGSGSMLYTGGAGGRTNGNRASAFSSTANGGPLWETTAGDGNVQALGLSPDGAQLYIGGHYATLNGALRQHFAAVDAVSGVLAAFAPTINSPLGVWAIDTNGAALYVGGDFTRVSGMVQEGFARFPANGPALAVTSGPANASVTAVTHPAYGGTAAVNSGGVARVEASVDGGTSSTTGVTCTGCGSPSATWSYTAPNALANGPHTITFLAVDTFGTASSVSRTVTIDTTAPVVAVTGGPADGSVTSNASPAYSGTATDGVGVGMVEVSVDGGAFSTSGIVCHACATPSATWNFTPLSPLADGVHNLSLRATDMAGNISSVATRAVTVTTAALSFLSVSATGGSATITATFSAPVKCTSASKVDFSASVNGAARTVGNTLCTGAADDTVDVVLQMPVIHGGETVTLNLIGKVTDVAGNQAPFPTTRTVVAGNAVPSLAVTSGPADGATSALSRPVYGGTATDSDGTVVAIEVSIDGGTFSTSGAICTSCGTASPTWGSTQTPPLPDGPHSFAFRSVDNAGAASAAVVRNVIVDTSSPTLTVSSGPADGATVATVSPTYGGAAADAGGTVARVEAGLDGAAPSTAGVTCTGCGSAAATWSFTPPAPLAGGGHSIAFRSVDLAGTPSAAVTRALTVDASAPIFLSLAATGGNAVVTATFSEPVLCSSVSAGDFVADIGGLAVTVSSAGCAGVSAATVPLTLASAPDGGATVTVTLVGTVTDPGGNAATGGPHSIAATDAAPSVSIDLGPAEGSAIVDPAPAWSGAAADADGVVVRVEASVDGAAYSPAGIACNGCGTTAATWVFVTQTPVADGAHTFTFRAVDGPGLVSPVATRHVTVDRVAPTAAVTSGPADGTLSTSSQPAYGGTAGDAGGKVAAVQASVDGGPFATTGTTCTGCGTASATWSYTPAAALADGTRTLAWRAVDQAGNASPSAGRTVVIDTTAPVFVSVQATPNVSAVTAVFSEPLKCSTVAKGDFSVSVNGVSRTVNTAACAGTSDDTVDLNIAGTVLAGNTISVSLVSTVKDQANLSAAFPTTRTVTVANAAPSLAVTSGPADGALSATASPTYGGTAADSDGTVARVEAAVDAGAFSTAGVTCTGCGTASVTWSFTPSALAGGGHSLTFRSVDNAGVLSATVRRTVTVDTSPPVVSVDLGVADGSFIHDPASAWSGTASDPGGVVVWVEVSVDGAAFSTVGVSCTGCGTSSATWVFTSASLADGAHTFGFRSVDGVSLVSSVAARQVTVDTVPPVLVGLGAAGAGSVVTLTFGEPVLCSSVGNGGFTATIDSVGVAVVGSACAGTSAASVTLTLASAPPGGAGVAVTVTGTVTDPAGNAATGTQTTTATDTSPPVVAVDLGPADGSSIHDPAPAWSGSASDPGGVVVRVEVSVDGAVFSTVGVACSGCGTASVTWVFTSASLADGVHTLGFRSVDGVGLVSSVAARQVTVDTVPPVLVGLGAAGAGSVVTLTFGEPVLCSSVGNGGFTATIDSVGVAVVGSACAGTSATSVTLTLASAPPGGAGVAVTVTGTVTDPAGNAATGTQTTTASNAAPGLTVGTGPADGSVTAAPAPVWTGTAGDIDGVVAGVEVSIDAAAPTTAGMDCTGCGTASATWTFTAPAPLADGPHSFSFQAVDGPGALSAVVTRTVTVDTVPPVFAGLAATADVPVVTLTFDEPVLCSSLDIADFSATIDSVDVVVTDRACVGSAAPSVTLTLASAPPAGAGVAVTLSGTVTDPAGNAATLGAQTTTAADNTPPALTVDLGPLDGSLVGDAAPAWAGSASDPGGTVATVEASVDGAGFTSVNIACTDCGTAAATWVFITPAPLADGPHTFDFRSVDGAGLLSPTVSRHVTVDATVPALTIGSGPVDGFLSTSTQATYGGTATDAGGVVSRVEASLDGASFTTAGVTCTSCGTPSATWSYTVSGLADGPHTVAWQPVDQAGNVSPGAGRSLVVDTTRPVFVSVQALSAGAVTTTFSEPLNCSTVSKGDFAVTVNGLARTVNSSPCTGTADATIDLNLSGALNAGDVVAVSLVNNVKDLAGFTAVLTTLTITV